MNEITDEGDEEAPLMIVIPATPVRPKNIISVEFLLYVKNRLLAALRGEDIDALAMLVIAGFFLVRLACAALLGLGQDETYTLVIARNLSLSYFDHPPLHQWLAHYSANLFGENWQARLPFLFLFCGTSWFLFRLTQILFDSKAALIALFALNVSVFFFASPGQWIVPDGVLLFTLSASALIAVYILFDTQRLFHNEKAAKWLTVGGWLGLALLSKYSALLFMVSLFLFLATTPRLRSRPFLREVYFGMMAAPIVFSPVLVWNAQHQWRSLAFQGARAAVSGFHPHHFFPMVVGQIAYLTPWVFCALAPGLLMAMKNAGKSEQQRFLLFPALLPIVFFTLIPLWGERGFPHWPMTGWFFAFPLAGHWLAKRFSGKSLRGFAIASTTLLLLIAAALIAQARWRLITPPEGVLDPTLEAYDWGALRDSGALDMRPQFIIAVKWMQASKIALAVGPSLPVLAIGDDVRGMGNTDTRQWIGLDSLLILPENSTEIEERLRPYFKNFGIPKKVTLGRAGTAEIRLIAIPAYRLMHELPKSNPL